MHLRDAFSQNIIGIRFLLRFPRMQNKIKLHVQYVPLLVTADITITY